MKKEWTSLSSTTHAEKREMEKKGIIANFRLEANQGAVCINVFISSFHIIGKKAGIFPTLSVF